MSLLPHRRGTPSPLGSDRSERSAGSVGSFGSLSIRSRHSLDAIAPSSATKASPRIVGAVSRNTKTTPPATTATTANEVGGGKVDLSATVDDGEIKAENSASLLKMINKFSRRGSSPRSAASTTSAKSDASVAAVAVTTVGEPARQAKSQATTSDTKKKEKEKDPKNKKKAVSQTPPDVSESSDNDDTENDIDDADVDSGGEWLTQTDGKKAGHRGRKHDVPKTLAQPSMPRSRTKVEATTKLASQHVSSLPSEVPSLFDEVLSVYNRVSTELSDQRLGEIIRELQGKARQVEERHRQLDEQFNKQSEVHALIQHSSQIETMKQVFHVHLEQCTVLATLVAMEIDTNPQELVEALMTKSREIYGTICRLDSARYEVQHKKYRHLVSICQLVTPGVAATELAALLETTQTEVQTIVTRRHQEITALADQLYNDLQRRFDTSRSGGGTDSDEASTMSAAATCPRFDSVDDVATQATETENLNGPTLPFETKKAAEGGASGSGASSPVDVREAASSKVSSKPTTKAKPTAASTPPEASDAELVALHAALDVGAASSAVSLPVAEVVAAAVGRTARATNAVHFSPDSAPSSNSSSEPTLHTHLGNRLALSVLHRQGQASPTPPTSRSSPTPSAPSTLTETVADGAGHAKTPTVETPVVDLKLRKSLEYLTKDLERVNRQLSDAVDAAAITVPASMSLLSEDYPDSDDESVVNLPPSPRPHNVFARASSSSSSSSARHHHVAAIFTPSSVPIVTISPTPVIASMSLTEVSLHD